MSIRPIIHHMVEGDIEHDFAKFIFERLVQTHRNPTMQLWSPDKLDAWRYRAEYPGLPDGGYTYRTGRELRQYIYEIETELTPQKWTEKLRQFRGPGITDVIPINLADFHQLYPDQSTDYVLLEKWLKQYLM